MVETLGHATGPRMQLRPLAAITFIDTTSVATNNIKTTILQLIIFVSYNSCIQKMNCVEYSLENCKTLHIYLNLFCL